MNETQIITCDTEVPMSTNDGNEYNHHYSRTYHNYSLPRGTITAIANANSTTTDKQQQQYDKPRKVEEDGDDRPITATPHCTQNNDASSNKCHSGIRNYDVPKDTINTSVLESGSQSSTQPVLKQPLLHGHHQQKHSESRKLSSTRPPPPTIVLSPPDDASPDKVKVIFEYDNEKYTIQPNFLIRYKRIILSAALSLLVFLLLIFVVVFIYVAYRRK